MRPAAWAFPPGTRCFSTQCPFPLTLTAQLGRGLPEKQKPPWVPSSSPPGPDESPSSGPGHSQHLPGSWYCSGPGPGSGLGGSSRGPRSRAQGEREAGELPRWPLVTFCWAVRLLLRVAASGPGPQPPPHLVWPRTGSGQCLPDGDDFWGMAVRTPRQVVGRRWTLGQSHGAVSPSRGFVRVPPGRVDVCVGDLALRHVHLPHLPLSGCARVSAPPGGPHGHLLLRNQNTGLGERRGVESPSGFPRLRSIQVVGRQLGGSRPPRSRAAARPCVSPTHLAPRAFPSWPDRQGS